MASNAAWVVPASGAERRFYVLDVSDEKVGDKKYFADIQDELEQGGSEAMLYELQRVALLNFHPRSMPDSAALNSQNSFNEYGAKMVARRFETRLPRSFT